MIKPEQIQEQRLNIKLEGINLQSFLELAQKGESSIDIEEQNDQSNCQKSNVAEISKGEGLEKSSRQLQDTSCFISNLDPAKKKSIQSEYDQRAVHFDDKNEEASNNLEFSEIMRRKADTQQMVNCKLSSSPYPKANRQITISAKPIINQQKIRSSRASQNQSHLSYKKQKWSGFNTTEKLVKLFTVVKPQLIKFFENYTQFGRYRHLSNECRSLIDDKADYIHLQEKQKKGYIFMLTGYINLLIDTISKIFYLILNKIPLFNPENKFRIMINAVIVCYNCFYLLLISFNIFFQAQFGNIQHTFHYIATAAWVSEMLIQMNTATYHDGDFITDRKTLFQIYLKEYFFFEILPLIFEGKTSPNTTINILLHLPLLLKLKGISIILEKLEFLILQHLKKHYIMQIFKLLLQLLLLIHLMACSFVGLAKYEQNVLRIQDTWLEKSQIYHGKDDWWNAYVEAQLWAFHTMGNSYSISVHSEYEFAFTSFWMLVSCVLYAYLINTLGNILSDINSNSENYKRDLNILNRYMKRKKIDIELQRVMNTHLVKQYEQESQALFDSEKETLGKLSIHMRKKLVTESNKNILQQFTFFQLFSQHTLQNVYQIMQEESYSEGQVIQTFDANTLDNFVYLILQGSGKKILLYYLSINFSIQIIVDIIQDIPSTENQDDSIISFQNEDKKKKIEDQKEIKKKIKTLGAGEQFGEYEFFANILTPSIIQSQKQTIVIKISRKKFVQIVSQNKSDYQKFLEVKQRVQFYNQMNIINSRCYICKSQNHHFLECTLTHLPKKSSILFFKHIYSPDQKRDINFQRKLKKPSKFVIMIISSQELISKKEYDEDQASISSNDKEDETSIYKKNQQTSFQNQNGSKLKFQQDSITEERKIPEPTSSIQDQQVIFQQIDKILKFNQILKKENVNEGTLLKLNTLGNNIGNINNSVGSNFSNNNNGNNPNRRSSFRASLIQRKSQITNFQDMLNLDRKELIERQNSQIEERDKSSIKNSINNLGDLSPKSNLQNQIYQPFKSSNIVTSIRAIRRSILNPPNIQLPELYLVEGGEQYLIQSFQDLVQKPSDSSILSGKRSSFLQGLKSNQQQQNILQKQKSNDGQNNNYTTAVENTIYRMKWDHSICYWAFEKQQEFNYFFPHNNCINVLRKFTTRQKILKEKKKLLQTKMTHEA